MKKALPILDFVINEDKCNLHCKYCYNNKNLSYVIFPQHLSKQLFTDIISIIKRIYEKFDIGVIKFSGGEILLYDNLIQLLKEVQPFTYNIQIQTNGLYLNRKWISEFEQLKNVTLQITLDGHLYAMNSYRMGRTDHQLLLRNVTETVKVIPTDITTCIHDRNIDGLVEFAEYIYCLSKSASLNFIPVRHSEIKFFPLPEQAEVITEMMRRKHLKQILPPAAYLVDLKKFIVSRRKYKFTCLIPIISLGVNQAGILKACPLLETNENQCLGNIIMDKEKALSEVGTGKIHRVLMHRNLHTQSCECCFSYLEVLNYYVQGKIGMDELKYCWLYRDINFMRVLSNCNGEKHG